MGKVVRAVRPPEFVERMIKIVLKAVLNGEALKVTCGTSGVESVTIYDVQKIILVIGSRIDPIVLVSMLRKKLGFVELHSVRNHSQILINGAPRRSHGEERALRASFTEWMRRIPRALALHFIRRTPAPATHLEVQKTKNVKLIRRRL